MKKTLLTTLAISALFFSATAQKGVSMVQVTGLIDKEDFSDVDNNSGTSTGLSSYSAFGMSAAYGYQISDHFSMGVLAGYSSAEEKYRELYQYSYGYQTTYQYVLATDHIKTWNVGIYGRYTQWLGKRFFVYGQFSADHYQSDEEYNDPGGNQYIVSPGPISTSDYYYYYNPVGNGWRFRLFPAVGMNIVNGWGINIEVGGLQYAVRTNYYSNNTQLRLALGEFSFGLHKIIGWRRAFDKPVVEEIRQQQ